MKERCADNIGNVRKQADLISYEYEEKMWCKGILGEDSPDKLQSMVLFLLGINLALHAVDEHYYLCRDMPDKMSQLSFKKNDKGVHCLVFCEDTCTKTNDRGLGQMQKEWKIVWIYPSKNINRYPVHLVDKYLGLCPSHYVKKPNFYLQSLKLPHPKQWYSHEVLGQNTIKKVVKDLLSSAEINGYFTNHSLRWTGGSRLFQAGIDQKLVKEYTGHRSDAVDYYQIISDKQRETLSEILACPSNTECKEKINEIKQSEQKSESEPTVTVVKENCTCKCMQHSSNTSEQVAKIVSEVFSKNMKTGTTIIKLEIELTE